MPPVVSGSNPFIKDEIAKIAREWFDIILYEMASAPRNTSPEGLWTRHSHLLDRGMLLYKQLLHIAHRSEYSTTSSTGLSLSRAEGALVTTQDMLTGAAAFVRASRYSSFSERCLGMPSPSTNPVYSSQRRLHEMLFESTDCFIELGRIRPANHGWLFVFREELEKWLLSAVNPFQVIYRDSKGQMTLYGVYRAVAFPEANMIGPEFAQLSDPTREIIATHLSRSSRGTRSYNAVYGSLIATHRTLRCMFFQCVETPLAHETWNIAPRVSANTCKAAQLNSAARNNLPSLLRSGQLVTPLKSDFLGQITRTDTISERTGRTSNTAAQCILHQGRAESSHAPPAPPCNITATLPDSRCHPSPNNNIALRPSLAMNGGNHSRVVLHTSVNGCPNNADNLNDIRVHVVPVPEPAQNGRKMGHRNTLQYSKTQSLKNHCV